MREEHHENENRLHKRKKTHKLYAAIVLSLGIIIICMALILLFYVQRIEIKGNLYCDDKVIVESVQNDRFSINSLYVMAKYALGKGEIPEAVETMDVKLKNPWTLSVTVKEKEIVGYIEKKKKRVYFDKEGMVLLNGLTIVKDVPIVKGAKFKNIKLYKKMECENTQVFDEIYLVTQELKKHELSTEKIQYISDRMYVYVGKTCVSLGTDITAEKISQIKPILKKLKKKKGTLHLEKYSSGNEIITFSIGEFPK